jgi:DEAD/DEAH box helicase domain-containing protein
MVLRRLLRLAALHSKNSPAQAPQFICCSATMENPVEHFSALLPLQACLGGAHHLCCIGVADDTSPQGDKTLVLWNPPKIPCRRFADGSNSSGDHAGRTLKRKSYNLSARSREKIKILASASAADKMGQAVPRPPSDGFYNQQYISIVGKGAAPLPKERTASATEAAVEACAHQVKEVQCHKEKKASDEDSGKESLSSSPEAPEVFRRKSPIVETAMLFSALVKQRIRTISFCRTRKLTEMVLQVDNS